MAAAEQLNTWAKLAVVHATLSNWPIVVLDKLGLVRECRYQLRSGIQMVCRPRSTDVNEVVAMASGLEYPREYLLVPDRACVIDLGANIGGFAVHFDDVNRARDYRGLAVEPYGPNFDLLVRNLALNGTGGRFGVVRAAVGNRDGWTDLDIAAGYDAVRVATDTLGDVRLYRLSSLCAEFGIAHVDLLKMDIEGAEYDVLDADLEFVTGRVNRILLEYHDLGDERNLAWIMQRLEPAFSVAVVHSGACTGVLHASNRMTR